MSNEDSLEDALLKIDEQEGLIDSLREKIAELEDTILDLKNEASSTSEELEQLKYELAVIDDLRQEIQDMELNLDEVKEKLDKSENKEEELKEKVDSLKDMLEEVLLNDENAVENYEKINEDGDTTEVYIYLGGARLLHNFYGPAKILGDNYYYYILGEEKRQDHRLPVKIINGRLFWEYIRPNVSYDAGVAHISGVNSEYWFNEAGELHNALNHPARKDEDGTVRYYFNGKLHRTDGPAVERPGAESLWYINGVKTSPEVFNFVDSRKKQHTKKL